MPLGTLGSCSVDLLEAEQSIRKYSREYCAIINGRYKPQGLPAYIQPPKNAVRWQPRESLTLPAPPETATDLAVISERIPLGYDGILISLTCLWNDTTFVEASGDITWRAKLDRRFIPFYDTITTSLGTLSTPFDIAGQGIPLYSGQLFQMYVNFAVGSDARLTSAGKTICAATGYIWPRERPAGL